MTTDGIDGLVTGTRPLPALAPDPVWSARLRSRCRARMAQRVKPAQAGEILGTALIGSFSALYLLGVVYDVVRLYYVP